MGTPENSFIQSVHKHLPLNDPYHMKNHNEYISGPADVWYSGSGGDLWVEYKFILAPKRDLTVVDLVGGPKPNISPIQQQWLTARHAEGRHVAVIVGCKEGGVFFDHVSWNATMYARDFRARIVSRKELADIIYGITHA